MKILITGGAGYVGFSLVEKLLENAAVREIVVYDNGSRRNLNFFFLDRRSLGEGSLGKNFGSRVRFVQADLLDNQKLTETLRGCDAVFHLAAKVITPFAEGDFNQFDQVNNWGTSFLAAAAEEVGCPHVVYLSSLSVYGNSDEPLNENSLAHPTTNYGQSKLRGEEHFARLAGKATLHIMRSGNVYGFNPCLRTDAVINNFLFKANFGQKLHIHGDGQQRRAFVHVDKLAAGLAELLHGNVPPRTWNFAEHNLSVLEILDLIRALYPTLEYRFVNPEFHLRSQVVETPAKIWPQMHLPEVPILEEFRAFKACFSF